MNSVIPEKGPTEPQTRVAHVPVIKQYMYVFKL